MVSAALGCGSARDRTGLPDFPGPVSASAKVKENVRQGFRRCMSQAQKGEVVERIKPYSKRVPRQGVPPLKGVAQLCFKNFGGKC